MSRRDFFFLRAGIAIIAGLFAKLLLHPALIPGNFGDIYGYHYPLRHLVTATLQAGRIPLWNPYIFAGTPLAANSQAVLFYPVSLIHYFLPLSWAFSVDVCLHAMLAFVGGFLLFRTAKVDGLGAWMLSLCYALSPFLIYRIAQGVPTLLAALAWTPWVWLAAISGRRALLACALALQVLSGHPQFCVINALMLVIWTVWRDPRRVRLLMEGAGLAAVFAAIQVLPTLQFLHHSIRTIWTSAFAFGYSMHLSYLTTLIFPNAWGNPLQHGFEKFPSEFFEMLTGYIGLLPLFLAGFALIRGRAARVYAVIAAVGMFFALGGNNPLLTPIVRSLGLDMFRIPARFSLLIILSVLFAASSGWRLLRKRITWMMAGILALFGVIDVACWSAPWVYAQRPAHFLSSDQEVINTIRDPRYRIATAPDIPAPNKSMLLRLYNAAGYEAYYLAPIAIFTSASERAPAADGSRTYIRKWDTPEMSRLAVRYYVTTDTATVAASGRRVGSAYIFENKNAGQLVEARGSTVEWSYPTPEHWIARAGRGAAVVFAQANFPGWKAWVDGVRMPISDYNGIFPGVVIPASTGDPAVQSVVHFRFLPGLWSLGVAITCAAIVFYLIYSISQFDKIIRLTRP